MDFEKKCLSLYSKYYDSKYKKLSDIAIKKNKKGVLSDAKVKEIETESQKFAIREAMLNGMKLYPTVAVAEIWDSIFKAHMFRKSGISDRNIIDKVVSADQSWKKSSGHAFEEMLKELGQLNLKGSGISLILQKDLSTLIKAGEIANEPRDISWLKEQTKGQIFDLYAIQTIDNKKYCFGCIQAKTSIRDRVTRDREPSIHAMQSYFWSVVFALDGDFLKLPKFQHMVNGGDTEFPENGWHGMYIFSNEDVIDRIYHTDLELKTFCEHIQKAANDWCRQRQWLDQSWRADITP